MSKKGLLIYNPEDYEKNKWFVNELLTKAPQYQLELQFVLRNQLVLNINENGTFTAFGKLAINGSVHKLSQSDYLEFKDLDFVINRTRDSLIGTHFENMGCKVFNSSLVTEICNHKGKTHQLVNSHGIPSVSTLLCHKRYFNPELLPLSYPVILKSVSGHGGAEVFKVEDEAHLMASLPLLPTEDFILQALCSKPGIDIRVFCLGKEIIAAVRRSSNGSFKSNYSLGGEASAYTLKPHEINLVKSILNLLDFDFVGIDFILDENENLLFNEIEDVVGTRTLYQNYPDIDIVEVFLYYIKKSIHN